MTTQSNQVAFRVLGDRQIDADHQEFALLIAQLVEASDAQIEAALAQLRAHAAKHFAQEDAELRALGGSANECHLDEHQSVLTSIAEVAELLRTGKLEIARTLGQELAHWLPNHIEEMDLRLTQALFKRRTGGAEIQIFKPGQLLHQE